LTWAHYTGLEGLPISRDVFTADPAALVVGDTVYAYVEHNNAKIGQFFTMPGGTLWTKPKTAPRTSGGLMKVRTIHACGGN